MKKYLLFLVVSGCFAQKNALHFSFFGNSPLLSLNYERKFKVSETGFWNANVGVDLGFLAASTLSRNNGDGVFFPSTGVPHALTRNFKLKKNYLEVGYAGVYMGGLAPGAHIGIRKINKKRTITRLYASPVYLGGGHFWPIPLGFSFGKQF